MIAPFVSPFIQRRVPLVKGLGRSYFCRRIPRYGMSNRRQLVTDSVEPPLSSLIPEKPCTLVLLEDTSFYKVSWHNALQEKLPYDFGVHYCQQKLPMTTLDEALDAMREDLAVLPAVVLVTRGPLVSLVAQYYLESLSLSGLIMVDPVFEVSALTGVKGREGIASTIMLDQMKARPLKLEAGAVPILVVTSISELQHASQMTASRHSDTEGPFGEVQMIAMNDDAEIPFELINNWIDEVVL